MHFVTITGCRIQKNIMILKTLLYTNVTRNYMNNYKEIFTLIEGCSRPMHAKLKYLYGLTILLLFLQLNMFPITLISRQNAEYANFET